MKKMKWLLMSAVVMAAVSAFSAPPPADEYVLENGQYVLKSEAIPRDGNCISAASVCTYLKDANGNYSPENPSEHKQFLHN